jgi:hypothetical protein
LSLSPHHTDTPKSKMERKGETHHTHKKVRVFSHTYVMEVFRVFL